MIVAGNGPDYTPAPRPPRKMFDATADDGRAGAGPRSPRIAATMGQKRLADVRVLQQRVGALLPTGLRDISFAASAAQALSNARKLARTYQAARKQAGRIHVLICSGPPQSDYPRAALDETDIFTGPALGDITTHLAALGPERVAALLVEPLNLFGGLLPPCSGYLRDMQRLAERAGVLLIFDETVTGLGRLGAATAAGRLHVTPDILVLGETLTNGVTPLGVLAMRAEFRGLLTQGAVPTPSAVTAALETLQIYDDEHLFQRAADLEPYWQYSVTCLADAPTVAEVRGIGLATAIALKPKPGAPGTRGRMLFQRCLDHGVCTRVCGDTLLLTPPLTISKDQIDDIIEKISAALRKIT